MDKSRVAGSGWSVRLNWEIGKGPSLDERFNFGGSFQHKIIRQRGIKLGTRLK